MKTVVETFLIEETVDLLHDNDQLDKWNERVEELGLIGQKTIIKKDKSPIPFMWMNNSLLATFEILCPTKVDVDKYDKTPIPVEILDLISLSNNEGHLDLIEVWYNEKSPDPVCIGYKFDPKTKDDLWYKKYQAQKYLIGRWADVKASLDSLVGRAKKMFIHAESIRLKQQIKDATRNLEDLEKSAEDKFGYALPETDIQF